MNNPISAYKITFDTPSTIKLIEEHGLENFIEGAKNQMEDSIRQLYQFNASHLTFDSLHGEGNLNG